jgi:hypothetical protein
MNSPRRVYSGVRAHHVAQLLGTKDMTDDSIGWDDSQCWFCKKRPAVPDATHELDLHRVLHRKSTYVVVGIQYKQQYETTKTWVPRCESCKRIHNRVGVGFIVLWLILGTSVIAWYISQSDKTSNSMSVNVFGGAIAILITYFMSAIPVGLLYMFTNIFWNSEEEAYSHPRVKALRDQKWDIGGSPSYKWSDPD